MGAPQGPTIQRRLSVLLCVLVVCLELALPVAEANACNGCFNGGQLRLPNNIFGRCLCKCQGTYKGPRCEFFVGKRSAEPALQDFTAISSEDRTAGSRLGALRRVMSRLRDLQVPEQPDFRHRRSSIDSQTADVPDWLD